MDAATSGDSQEAFFVLLLDTKNKVIGAPACECRGLLDRATPFHPPPRGISGAGRPVRQSAASVILAHNHPSGDPTPSKEDIEHHPALVEPGSLAIRV